MNLLSKSKVNPKDKNVQPGKYCQQGECPKARMISSNKDLFRDSPTFGENGELIGITIKEHSVATQILRVEHTCISN